MNFNRISISLFVVCLVFGSFASAAEKYRVGIAMYKNGPEAQQYKLLLLAAAARAKRELQNVDVVFREGEPIEQASKLAAENFDLIFVPYFGIGEKLPALFKKFPKINFVVVEGDLPGNNVASINFRNNEGAFLAGALAALKSTASKVGFVSAVDQPFVAGLSSAFAAGAKRVNPKISVTSKFIGTDNSAWENPSGGRITALSIFDSGADVVYTVAGGSSPGVFSAAKERKKFAIAANSNQNSVSPGAVLSSVVKKIDLAVFQTIRASRTRFVPGKISFGIKEGAFAVAIDSNNRTLISASQQEALAKLERDISSGKVRIY